ncbi:MAG: hypothetical protein A2W93_02100 [Bacteroidetes bacterium GWF2_43_63]|nr:MAG: hypothetical protein A2W94_09975 [Bacteroidetes bacterium GWE2_42_42]OFY55858.1 MAG: hypothetical protein A2W93_02100 [Bacteroidetes bacterium GWF2_43_63]HBG71221.1 hypothetical protein [Bacteroidales bacterium]HCB60558.1 hypothetical protein [Bacteroidales bacterium]HCY22485.1 hypothetical protein [Bacteroidales bacterium]
MNFLIASFIICSTVLFWSSVQLFIIFQNFSYNGTYFEMIGAVWSFRLKRICKYYKVSDKRAPVFILKIYLALLMLFLSFFGHMAYVIVNKP